MLEALPPGAAVFFRRGLGLLLASALVACSDSDGPQSTKGKPPGQGEAITLPGLPVGPTPIGLEPALSPTCPPGFAVDCGAFCCPSGDECGESRCLITAASLRCTGSNPVTCDAYCCPYNATCDSNGLCVVSHVPCTGVEVVCSDATCCPSGTQCGAAACEMAAPGPPPNQPGAQCPPANLCSPNASVCCGLPNVGNPDPRIYGECVHGACVRPGEPTGCSAAGGNLTCGSNACCPSAATCGACGCPPEAPTGCGTSCCGPNGFCGSTPNTCLGCNADGDHPLACPDDGCCLAAGSCNYGRCSCPASMFECGQLCCDAGETCNPAGGCCPAGFSQPCGGSCCADVDRCIDGTCKACPEDRPSFCGDELCCPENESCQTCPSDDKPSCGDCPAAGTGTTSCDMSGHSLKTCANGSQKCCLDGFVCCLNAGEVDCNPPAFCQ